MRPRPLPVDSRIEDRFRRTVSLARLRRLEQGRPVTFQVLEPVLGIGWEGVWPHADSPEVAALAARVARRAVTTARLDAALAVEVGDATIAGLVAELVGIDPVVLDRAGRLRYVMLSDRVAAWSQAQASTALAVYAGPVGDRDADPAAWARRDRQLRLEVRVARRISDDAAGRDLDAARRLAGELAGVRAAWSRGVVGFRHVAAFLDRTRNCSPELTLAVLDRVGDRLVDTPSTRIGSVIAAALAASDPRGQADRARHARRHEVGVTGRTLPDGLGQITVIDTLEATRAMIERIDDDADRVLVHARSCAPCARCVPPEIGPARAAAFRAIFLGHDTSERTEATHCADDTATLGAAASATAPPPGRGPRRSARRSRRGELQVVIDLATLIGLAENPALLAGQPVPADLARELATGCGSLRRIVTDPVDGHLLDYGTRTYLPAALKNHIAARDGTCRAPGCNQPAHRCQLDHVTSFPQGPSDLANTHALCRRDHTTKTDGDLRILDHHADGTARWRTRDGQTCRTPPRPYLPDPGTPPPTTPPPTTPSDDEPCPF